VGVGANLGQQPANGEHIQGAIAVRHKLHTLTIGLHEPAAGRTEQATQPGQHHAQVVAGSLLGRIGPEQADQRFAAVPVLLNRQESQQRQLLAHPQVKRLAGKGDPWRAKQVDAEEGHCHGALRDSLRTRAQLMLNKC